MLASFLYLTALCAGPVAHYPPGILYIDPAGNDSSGDGSSLSPFRTLQRAVDVIDVGGTVLVRPGTYPFAVTVSKTVRIEALSTGVTLGPIAGTGAIVTVDNVDDVVIVGVTFSGASSNQGIRAVNGADRLSVQDCQFTACGTFGILIDSPASVGHVVLRSEFSRVRRPGVSSTAIRLAGCSQTIVDSCTFSDGDRGIDILSSPNTAVRSCEFADLSNGAVFVGESADLRMRDCTVRRCAHLPSPISWNFPTDPLGAISIVGASGRATLQRVMIDECGGYTGLNTYRTPYTPRYDGMFAVGIETATQVTLEDCSILRNRFGGVYVVGGAQVTIQRSNIAGNGGRNSAGFDTGLFSFQGCTVTASNNFWGSLSGPSHDGEGYGNGVDGSGNVTTTPFAATPFDSGRTEFTPLASLPTGSNPRGLIAADVNGDGRPDLVVAEQDAGTIRVFLRTGPDRFGVGLTTSVGGSPVAVASGQLNGDAFLDLAVLDAASGLIVLFGDGAGRFPSQTQFALPPRPVRLRVGNLDQAPGDEIVVACQGDLFQAGGLRWLRSDGNGGFTIAALPGTQTPIDVELMDIDADSRPEVLALDMDHAGPGLRVYPNLGAGSFGTVQRTPIGADPWIDGTITRCNLDGGAQDIAIANYEFLPVPGRTRIHWLRGTGTGFAPPLVLHQEVGPVTLAASEFTAANGTHFVLLNAGLRRIVDLGPWQHTPALWSPVLNRVFDGLALAMTLADFSGDGFDDLAVAEASGKITVLRAQRPHLISHYGHGCVGSIAVPVMVVQSIPEIGVRSFGLAVDRGRPNTPAYLVVGTSSASVPLPPNDCPLLVQPLVTLSTVSDTAGFARIGLPLPMDLNLLGGNLYAQWFLVDSEGGILNVLSSSEGVRLRVGG